MRSRRVEAVSPRLAQAPCIGTSALRPHASVVSAPDAD